VLLQEEDCLHCDFERGRDFILSIVENLNGDHSPERKHGLFVNSISCIASDIAYGDGS
jgi:hypothetical protein